MSSRSLEVKTPAERIIIDLALDLVGMIEEASGYCGDNPVDWVVNDLANDPTSRFCERARTVAEASKFLGEI